MRITLIFILAFVARATTAGATYYLDERFEGAFPPDGWTNQGNQGGWDQRSGGPSAKYAHSYLYGSSTYNGWATLESPAMNIPSGTVYYRFEYYYGYGGWPYGNLAEFVLYYAGTAVQLVRVTFPGGMNWGVCAGTAVVSQSLPVVARWRHTCSSYGMHGSTATFNVDTTQISDAPMTAVTPASLGRIKALYK